MKKEIASELVVNTKKWLTQEGINHFIDIKTKHGKINAIWLDGGIPHPVYLREGMQIRNFMRDSEYCIDWTDHDFDDNWVELIEECIK